MKRINYNYLLLCLCFWLPIVTMAQEPQKNYTLKGEETGTKSYVARDFITLQDKFHYKPGPGESFSAKIDQRLLFAPADASYMTPEGTITTDPAKGGMVGSVKGQLNVTPSGAATYNIPIECPAGINGMQPNVALFYNSQSGNGIAGWGWNISGLSTISRVSKNYLHDNERTGIIWDKTSPLALDGNRLFVHNEYATDSIEYWPEKDMVARVVGYNIQAYGPENIIVYSKDGKKLFYGSKHSDASYIPLEGLVTYVPGTNIVMDRKLSKRMAWRLVKVEDANGNYMEFNYDMDTFGSRFTSHRISNIKYGANKNASASHFGIIEFKYESRSDVEEKYINGSLTKQTYRLNEVVVKASNQEYRRYNLKYRYDEVSKLESVGQSSNGVSLPPITFNWFANDYSFSKKQERYSFPDSPNFKAKAPDHQLSLNIHGGDFDGDGINDFVLEECFYSGSLSDTKFMNWALYLNNGTRSCSFKAEGYYSKKYWANGLFVFDKDGDGKSELYVKKHVKRCHTTYLDDSNDPIEEELIEESDPDIGSGSSVTTCVHYLSLQCFEMNGSNFERNENKDIDIRLEKESHHDRLSILPGDYDGDGDLDFVTYYSDGTFYRAVGIYAPKKDNNLGGSKGMSLLDFNGDGKTDLLLKFNDNIDVLSYNKGTNKFEVIYNSPTYNRRDKIKVGDFNGDGNSDLLIRKYNLNKWMIAQSDGTKLIDGITTPSLQHGDLSEYRIDCTDVNQDGKCDILYFKDASPDYGSSSWSPDYQLNVLVSNGSGFTVKSYLNDLKIRGNSEAERLTTIGNFDKSGGIDFVLHDNNPFAKYLNEVKTPTLFGFKDGAFFNKISSVTNSLSNRVDIKYTYTGLHNVDGLRRSDSEYGSQIKAEKSIGFVIVEAVTGKETNLIYGYGRSVVNKTGRGFLGFDLFAVTDQIKGKIAVSEYDYDIFKKILYLKKEYAKLTSGSGTKGTNLKSSTIGSGSFISEVIYNTVIKTDYTKPNKCFQQYVDKVTTKDHLTNTGNTKSFTFDKFLNRTKEVQKFYSDHSESNLVLTIENSSPVFLQKGAWCANKPESVATKRTKGGESHVRTVNFVYNGNGNVTRKTTDPGDANQVITNYKNYNSFGIPENIETVASGKTRSTTFVYSTSGRFLKEKINDFTTFKTSYTYDESKGVLNTTTNHLGLTTSYKYDGFGRKIKTSFPDGTHAVNALQWANGNGPTGAKYYAYTERSGESPVWKWYDDLGREIRTESYGLDTNRKIWVDTDYNAIGQVQSVSEPYFANGVKKSAASYLYDELGRVTTLTTPMGNTTTVYGGLTTTVTSPNGVKEEVRNGAGQIMTSTVNGGAVSFDYWPSGLTKTATPAGGKAVKTFFNLQGRRIKLIDPDAGTIDSEYNGFGELTWEEHKKTKPDNTIETIRTTYNYDNAGRVLTTVRNGVTTTTVYNSSTGLVESIAKPGHEVSYKYDENGMAKLGRVTTTTEKIENDKSFSFKSGYDAFGRENRRTYPSGFYTTNHYNKYGYLTEVKSAGGKSIWKAIAANARGQLKRTKKGVLETSFAYDEERGLPQTILADGVIDHHYIFNEKGNLQSREDFISHHLESFTYKPENNQLASWTIKRNGALLADYSMDYDGHGNIISKSDVGYAMKYDDPTRIHAITGISGNPSLIADELQTITYTDFKKVQSVTEGDYQLTLTYGIDHQRRKGVFEKPGNTLTRYYLGDYEEDHINGTVKKTHYISGGNGLAALYIEQEGAGKLYYAYTDYLGSLVALTNEDGSIATLNGTQQRLAFDPWGNRRNPNNWSELITKPTHLITDRGYTMHEHLDDLALINMNGRVFDPQIARFLSPDPYIQSAGNLLSYNRYTYGYNNPLTFTDPSGELPFIAVAIIGAFVNTTVQATKGNLTSTGRFWGAMGVGAASSIAGYGAGALVGSGLSISGAAGGALAGGAGGAAGGFVGGSGNAWVNGASFGDGLTAGFNGAVGGAIGGAIIGGISGGIEAYRHDGNILNGNGSKYDLVAPQQSQDGTIEVGEGMTYSTEYAQEFSDEHFGIDPTGVDELIADGSVPDGYTTQGDYVKNTRGQSVFGTAVRTPSGLRDIYIYKLAFQSKEMLYITMGHEYLHASYYATGLLSANRQHSAISEWMLDQATLWNFKVRFFQRYANHFSNYADIAYDYTDQGFFVFNNRSW